MFPPGWEARRGTLFLIGTADGDLVFPVPIIFHGTGTSRKIKEEMARLHALYPNVRIYFQKKAWMTSEIMRRIAQDVRLSFYT